jgi:hypothetical protein
MAQYIKNADIFGRVGSGIGQGLAEQVPKEIERHRLASGLNELANDSQNLSQFQRFAKLAAIPGITPQAIQSGTEILNREQLGNAYRRSSGSNPRMGQQNAMQPGEFPSSRNQLPNDGQNFRSGQIQNGQQNIPVSGNVENQQRTPNVRSNEDIPQTAEGNPLNEKNLTRLPWTPQQRQSTVSDYIDQGFLPEQARQLAADDEARDLGEPTANKQRQLDIEEGKGKARESLQRHLETKLQKNKEGLFTDIDGPMMINAERGMIRDLILNPKADIDNIANDWSDRLYRTAIAKGKLKTLGKTTGFEALFKGDTLQKKLKEYQDIFKRSGNLEEYKNILQGPDIGLSHQGSASVAYPPNEKINKYLSKYKSSSGLHYKAPQKAQEARKAALEIENDLGPDDSVLSVVRKLSEIDPYFDQQAFLDQISDDKDQLRLNERQRLELGEGVANILPNWADLLYLPIFRR